MTFDLQPTLSGPLVNLRPLLEGDFSILYAVASDPLIWDQHPARNRYQEPVFQEFFEAAIASGGALLLEDALTGSVIGSSRFAGYSPETSEVEIGWTFLARTHWGGGYNAAVKKLMLEHAFKAVDSVVFKVGSQNIRSQKAVLKLGAVLEGPATAGGTHGFCFRLSRAAYCNSISPTPLPKCDA
jgi:RimJ/RimL family protein N-acetyltransferase